MMYWATSGDNAQRQISNNAFGCCSGRYVGNLVFFSGTVAFLLDKPFKQWNLMKTLSTFVSVEILVVDFLIAFYLYAQALNLTSAPNNG